MLQASPEDCPALLGVRRSEAIGELGAGSDTDPDIHAPQLNSEMDANNRAAIAVGAEGVIGVAWTDTTERHLSGDGCGPEIVDVAVSTDFGRTFSTPQTAFRVTTVCPDFRVPNGPGRSSALQQDRMGSWCSTRPRSRSRPTDGSMFRTRTRLRTASKTAGSFRPKMAERPSERLVSSAM